MRLIKQLFVLAAGVFILSCSNDAALKKQAYDLAHKFIITDGHIDVPWRLNDGYEDLSVRTDGGDFDYVDCSRHGPDCSPAPLIKPKNLMVGATVNNQSGRRLRVSVSRRTPGVLL